MNTINEVVKVTRKASSDSGRYIELHVMTESGKVATRVLGTQITKVELPEAFAKIHSGKTAPIEQYGFKVEDRIFTRFADATAVVLKRHNVVLDSAKLEKPQIYLAKALRIISGEDGVQDVTEQFAAAKESVRKIPTPAVEEVTEVTV